MKENKENSGYYSSVEEDEDDALSFCNLPLGSDDHNSANSPQQSQRTGTSSPQIDQIFDFFTGFSSQPYTNPDITLIIPQQEEEQNEYQKRDYFAMVKSSSFRKPSSNGDEVQLLDNLKSSSSVGKNRSRSTTLSNSTLGFYQSKSTRGLMDYHVQRVNISSLTSMSAKSRRRMFMFGPVKFKPEMEMSAIKQRQGRLRPTVAKFPAETTSVSDGGAAVAGRNGSYSRGLRSSKSRSHLATVLARSFSCIQRVAN